MSNQTIDELSAGLSDSSLGARQNAAEQLAQRGAEAQRAACALARACNDEDETVREHAVATLEDLGPPASADLPALLALLKEMGGDAAYWTATLIGRLKADAAPAVADLSEVLTHAGETSVRERAAWALGQIGRPAAPALQTLEQACLGQDKRLARLAREAINQIRG